VMDGKERRIKLLEELKNNGGPLTGACLAKKFKVSRQVIVSDFAILRAGGVAIYATPQGYILPPIDDVKSKRATLACKHEQGKMAEELAIIIDNGGKVLDVIVEHPLYGALTAKLMLTSRRDLAEFIRKITISKAQPLASITGGVHLHTIEVADREMLARIESELRGKGILIK
jgi:transcriptional regulator of NAD metabolism